MSSIIASIKSPCRERKRTIPFDEQYPTKAVKKREKLEWNAKEKARKREEEGSNAEKSEESAQQQSLGFQQMNDQHEHEDHHIIHSNKNYHHHHDHHHDHHHLDDGEHEHSESFNEIAALPASQFQPQGNAAGEELFGESGAVHIAAPPANYLLSTDADGFPQFPDSGTGELQDTVAGFAFPPNISHISAPSESLGDSPESVAAAIARSCATRWVEYPDWGRRGPLRLGAQVLMETVLIVRTMCVQAIGALRERGVSVSEKELEEKVWEEIVEVLPWTEDDYLIELKSHAIKMFDAKHGGGGAAAAAAAAKQQQQQRVRPQSSYHHTHQNHHGYPSHHSHPGSERGAAMQHAPSNGHHHHHHHHHHHSDHQHQQQHHTAYHQAPSTSVSKLDPQLQSSLVWNREPPSLTRALPYAGQLQKLNLMEQVKFLFDLYRQPMRVKEIIDIQRGCGSMLATGKTPENSLASRIYTDMKSAHPEFCLVEPGLFYMNQYLHDSQ